MIGSAKTNGGALVFLSSGGCLIDCALNVAGLIIVCLHVREFSFSMHGATKMEESINGLGKGIMEMRLPVIQ